MPNHAEFAVHQLNSAGLIKARIVAKAFDELMDLIVKFGVDGRALALAKTKLEESCFYAKKSIALGLENQEK
jgi:hypothetical protein